MIGGDLSEAFIAFEITTRVSHMTGMKQPIIYQGGHQRTAHPFEFAAGRGLFHDNVVGIAESGNHAVPDLLLVASHFSDLRNGEKIHQGLDCHPTGNLARIMASHPIGNDEQIAPAEDAEAVFIVVTDSAGVRPAKDREFLRLYPKHSGEGSEHYFSQVCFVN
jgi:hypothetical protein